MEEKLKTIMADVFSISPSCINENTRREDIPTWDSAAHMELVLTLEEEFEVHFDDEEVIELVSYRTLLETLQRLGARNPSVVY